VTGGVWIASYVLLWVAVLVLAVAVVVLLRQIGVLHARLRPMGVHHAGEGPPAESPAPRAGGFAFDAHALTLVAFTSPTCQLCAALLPALRVLVREYDDLGLEVVDHGAGTEAVFAAWQVTSTPYVVAVDRFGLVRGGGIANNLEQVEELVAVSLSEELPRA
jgi:hypothetical protein